MEHEGSLLHSEVPTTCSYTEPARSSPNPQIPLPEDPSYIILPSTSGSSMWPLSLRFPQQNLVYAFPFPIRATYPAHLILPDFITRTISGDQYRSLSSSLCSYLHSPVTLSLLGPYIFSSNYTSVYLNL